MTPMPPTLPFPLTNRQQRPLRGEVPGLSAPSSLIPAVFIVGDDDDDDKHPPQRKSRRVPALFDHRAAAAAAAKPARLAPHASILPDALY